jgi:hypothetical protein
MDAIWEARIRLALCLDENGRWRNRQDEFAAPFSRVRVELKPGDGGFVPLIDGPVAQFDTALDSQPGKSSVTLVVRDDTVFLNREEDVEPPFENRADSDVAEEVFRRFAQIAETRIEPTRGFPPVSVREGTEIDFLRKLAKLNGCRAYVLPGDEPEASIGCFLPDPEDPADLPPLVLIGDGRNLADATITEDSEGPERTRARTLVIADQSIVSFEASTQDIALMADLPAVPDELEAVRTLPPEDNQREDLEPATSGQNLIRSYAFRLASRVVPGCYPAVLTPYRKVEVRAGATPYSGEYLIEKVTHRITPSLYTQELEAIGNSRTDVPAGGGAVSVALGAGGVF